VTERGPKKDLVGLLREADAELQQQRLSPEADRRLRALVEGKQQRGWRPSLVLAPVAAAAVALLVWALLPDQGTAPPARDRMAGFSVVAGTARAQQKNVRCLSTACTLAASDQRTRLQLSRGAVVRRQNRHIRVISGKATLDVKPRRRGPDGVLRVYVSHGHIQVLGTMFTVEQQAAGGGSVTLRRGAIRFVGHLGQVQDVAPGQTLTWPLSQPKVAATPKEVEPPKPTKKARPARKLSEEEAESLHNKVGRLRSQNRWGKAAQVLRSALPRIKDRVTRERFSYELGAILTYELPDAAAACSHWKRHLRRYGPGRYGEEITQARRKAACLAAKKQK